jgi:hypothetical protein
MKRSILPALLASVLVLSGCGANEEDEAKASISDFLMKQQSEDQMVTLKQDEADCISEGMVDGIGVDQLQEYGLLEEDNTVAKDVKTPEMSKADAQVMVDSMFDCTDVMKTMKDELASSMGQQPPEVKECFEKALNEEAVRGMLVATFSGDQDKASKELVGPLMECAGQGLPQN